MNPGAEKLRQMLPPFTVIGHRGAAGLAPENTLLSFRTALELGCPMLELDVYRLAGAAPALCVIHDETLDRTTNRSGPVAELSAELLTRIDAGQGQAIPTLHQVIELLNDFRPHPQGGGPLLNIELKGPETAAPVAATLRQHPDLAALVSSFDHSQLTDFRRLDSTTPVAPLYSRWRKNWPSTAAQLGAAAVNLAVRIARPERIRAIAAEGYNVFVYTVNDPATARQLHDAGASGIFTDRPDLMQRWLGATAARSAPC